MKKLVFILILLTWQFGFCTGQSLKVQQALNFENKGLDIIALNPQNDDSLRVALTYLSKALTLDDSRYQFYIKKASLQCKLGIRDSALKTINLCISRHPEPLVPKIFKGMLYDNMNDDAAATASYKTLFDEYSKLAVKYPDSTIIQLNTAMLSLYIKGKDAGIERYKELLQKYPNDPAYNFDRKAFAATICK